MATLPPMLAGVTAVATAGASALEGKVTGTGMPAAAAGEGASCVEASGSIFWDLVEWRGEEEEDDDDKGCD